MRTKHYRKTKKAGNFKTIQMYFFPMTCDECLKIPLVMLVVKMKYNFDASDPPRLHQMAPLSVQISKKFLRVNAPNGHLVGCLRHPDHLLPQNDLLLQIFLRRLL